MAPQKLKTRTKSTRTKRVPAADQPATTASYVVDGIEGGVARVERPDGTTADYPLAQLPKGVQEGDVVAVRGDGALLTSVIDHGTTQGRRQKAQDTLTELNAGAPTGNLDL